ncbi:hypothetical protein JCM21142_93687 [Saccharicrinis fermentans DSM 9555 = JCM 21142]|uniref:Right handed beta helix domain-containing protein n=1 Tax=Saccharicrinis fermentans DSM 9555 = JCM 21142 TaxID=869213 RepID=W7YR89_9BACT|nr:hypothetical protein JCM21142_93687 [Saccharicrinis fermentans DSM 9555 = JCM 21142]
MPIRTTVANNIIYNSNPVKTEIVKYYDKPGDINFQNNYVQGVESKAAGFISTEMKVLNKQWEIPLVAMGDHVALFDGFDFDKITKDIFMNERKPNQAGAISSSVGELASLFDFNMYGPSWFSWQAHKPDNKRISVKSSDEFIASLKEMNAGDTIIIATDLLKLEELVKIQKSVCIKSLSKDKAATIQFVGGDYATAFELGPDVNFLMQHISLEGDPSLNFIAPDKSNMSIASNVYIDDCKIRDFKSVYHSIKGSFADTIKVVNSSMNELVRGFVINSEDDAKGDYNAEFVILENNQVAGIQQDFVDYYRGGYDESTVGGNFIFKGNIVENAGKRGSQEVLLKTHGIVHVTINDNTFKSIKSGLIARLWGEKNNVESGNVIAGSSKIITEEFLAQRLMY